MRGVAVDRQDDSRAVECVDELRGDDSWWIALRVAEPAAAREMASDALDEPPRPWWQRLLPGVVMFSRQLPTRRQRLRAALAWAGPEAVITGVDALRAHGIPLHLPPEVRLLVPVNHRLSVKDFIVVERTTRLPVPFMRDGMSFPLHILQAPRGQLKLAALGRLTANIAHEIRNPLGAISHAAQLLQEEPGVNDTVARLITIINENSRRLDRMVNDVLLLNRGERAHRERFRLSDFLSGFIEQFSQIEKIERSVFRVEAAADRRSAANVRRRGCC